MRPGVTDDCGAIIPLGGGITWGREGCSAALVLGVIVFGLSQLTLYGGRNRGLGPGMLAFSMHASFVNLLC